MNVAISILTAAPAGPAPRGGAAAAAKPFDLQLAAGVPAFPGSSDVPGSPVLMPGEAASADAPAAIDGADDAATPFAIDPSMLVALPVPAMPIAVPFAPASGASPVRATPSAALPATTARTTAPVAAKGGPVGLVQPTRPLPEAIAAGAATRSRTSPSDRSQDANLGSAPRTGSPLVVTTAPAPSEAQAPILAALSDAIAQALAADRSGTALPPETTTAIASETAAPVGAVAGELALRAAPTRPASDALSAIVATPGGTQDAAVASTSAAPVAAAAVSVDVRTAETASGREPLREERAVIGAASFRVTGPIADGAPPPAVVPVAAPNVPPDDATIAPAAAASTNGAAANASRPRAGIPADRTVRGAANAAPGVVAPRTRDDAPIVETARSPDAQPIALATPPIVVDPASATTGADVAAAAAVEGAGAQLAAGGAERVLDLARQSAWVDGIARDIARAGQGDSVTRFTVQPAHLGLVEVRMTRDGTAADIVMAAADPDARARLDEGRHMLDREAKAHGVELRSVRIEAPAAASATNPGARNDQGATNSLTTSGYGGGTGGSDAGGQAQRDPQPRSQPGRTMRAREDAAQGRRADGRYA